MPRLAREKSETGIYHVIIRGANKQEIFHDEEDNLKFLETLKKNKEETELNVYGWCLMGNHVHLLLREGNESLSTTMKRIGVSFVWFYNQKYETTGHLFQDRFKSEPVETDKYLLTVIRYIHQNPVKARLVKRPAEWKWSSSSAYYEKETYPKDLLDCEFILSLLSENKKKAKKLFIEFNERESQDKCLEDTAEERLRLSDEEARMEISNKLQEINIAQVKGLPKKRRDEILRKIKTIDGLSQRQAARILGISPSLIFKA